MCPVKAAHYPPQCSSSSLLGELPLFTLTSEPRWRFKDRKEDERRSPHACELPSWLKCVLIVHKHGGRLMWQGNLRGRRLMMLCAFSMRCLTTAERAAGRREAGCARWLVAYRNAVVCLLVWIPVACYKRRSSSLFRGRKNHSWCSRKLHLYKQRPRDCTQNKVEMETNRRRRSGNY